MSVLRWGMLSLIFVSINTYSQSLALGGGIQYLHHPQWNKAVQAYNFSRPFLSENLPPMNWGWEGVAAYWFDTESDRNKQGVQFRMNHNGISANHAGFDVRFRFLRLSSQFLFRKEIRNTRLSYTGGVGLEGGWLWKWVNGSPPDDDVVKYQAFGGGIQFFTDLGVHCAQNRGRLFLSGSWSPFFYAPSMGQIIFQRPKTENPTFSRFLQVGVGFQWHLLG